MKDEAARFGVPGLTDIVGSRYPRPSKATKGTINTCGTSQSPATGICAPNAPRSGREKNRDQNAA